MEKAALLIDALLSGKTLEKNHAKPDDLYYETREMVEILKCETYDTGHKYFYTWGWGSALGRVEDRLLALIREPESWTIAENS